MKRLQFLIALLLTLQCATARAAPLTPRAIIDGRGVTVLTWTQPQPAQICIYDEVLLFCAQYQAGAQRVVLGRCDPCVAHVRAGDVLTLREVGGGGSVRVGVLRRWDLWLALMRK